MSLFRPRNSLSSRLARLASSATRHNFTTNSAPPSATQTSATRHTATSAATAPDPQKLTVSDLRRSGRRKMLQDQRKKQRRSLGNMGVPHFGGFLKERTLWPIERVPTKILQVNIGLFCNMSCNHCHVESSPQRTEMMDRKTAEKVIQILERSPSVTTVDITGGAPELNPQFRFLVTECRRLGLEVIDRCNLTCLYEPGQEDLLEFLRDTQCHIIASLPCYEAKNVNKQRGAGTFDKSIQGLIDLNKYGFGVPGSDLKLDLVYNPQGPTLPPSQKKLEAKYKLELFDHFGIHFGELFCFSNMPLKRYCDYLYKCRDLVSVSWDGKLYDCDFNQAAGIPMDISGMQPDAIPSTDNESPAPSIFDLESLEPLVGREVATDFHCFGCTAGAGSS
eukprot:450503_1